jgi:hypothetical protein
MMDHGANREHILNDNWAYVSYKTFTCPANVIAIGSSLYMTGDLKI